MLQVRSILVEQCGQFRVNEEKWTYGPQLMPWIIHVRSIFVSNINTERKIVYGVWFVQVEMLDHGTSASNKNMGSF